MRIARNILTIALLLFVIASVAAVFLRDGGGQQAWTPPAGDSTVVFYFHGSERCDNCRNMEEWTRGVVETAFAEDLSAGRLRWQILDRLSPQGSALAQCFGLTTNMVVVARYENGRLVRHAMLGRVWELLTDKAAFQQYIRDELGRFIAPPGASTSSAPAGTKVSR
jgi:hypothetical protein